MKLGTETGSLVNHVMSRSSNPEPHVGMGATLLSWTDRLAATVISYDGKLLCVQRDNEKRIDNNGMSECQEYECTPNPHAMICVFKHDKDGSWREVILNPVTGRYNLAHGYRLVLGVRRPYHDFSF